MEEYRTAVARSLAGVVKVDIARIDFNKELGLREADPTITDHLENLFSRLKDDPDTSKHLESTRLCWDNHVEAEFDSDELEQLLRNSRLTRESLQNSIRGTDFPKLELVDRKLQCLHGRHRLLAASRVLGQEDCWWPVRIYSFDPRGMCQSPFRSS